MEDKHWILSYIKSIVSTQTLTFVPLIFPYSFPNISKHVYKFVILHFKTKKSYWKPISLKMTMPNCPPICIYTQLGYNHNHPSTMMQPTFLPHQEFGPCPNNGNQVIKMENDVWLYLYLFIYTQGPIAYLWLPANHRYFSSAAEDLKW